MQGRHCDETPGLLFLTTRFVRQALEVIDFRSDFLEPIMSIPADEVAHNIGRVAFKSFEIHI